MKYIKVPKPITLTDPESGKVILRPDPENPAKLIPDQPTSFFGWLARGPLRNEELSTTERLPMVAEIILAFKGAEPGTRVALESDTWKALMGVIDKTSWGQPLIAVQYMPNIEAMRQASNSAKELQAVAE